MKKENRLILIDGSAYIFRAYYALPPMNRKDGTPVNAVFGFTNMLVKLIEDYREERLIVIFDAARENFRNKIFKDYKANRGETPEDLIPQFDLIKKCVKAFNIPQLEIEGFEADDIIATYSTQATKLNIPSLIVSSDKDLMQLVNEKVQMLDPMKNKTIGIDQVIEKFGVSPNKVVQIQALTGDKVDNIPGAPGIGPKTALELIKEYGDIEKLIENADRIKQEKRKNVIKDSAKDIRVSLQLVTLDKEINLPLKIEDIQPFTRIKNNKNSINSYLQQQGFKVIQQRLENNFFINDSSDTNNNQTEFKVTKTEYITISKISELKELYKDIQKIGYLAIDTETNSLNIEKADLVGISISFDEKKAYYIPLIHKKIETKVILENQIALEEAIKIIKIICSDPSILKIGQNLKYDIRILKKYGVIFRSIDDTMLLSYALDNGLTRHGMDDLAYRHLNHSTIKFKDLVGTGKKQITFDYVPIDVASKYAAEDALITLKLYNQLKPRLIKEKLSSIYELIDKPLINVLSSMEENGIKVNKKYLQELSDIFLNESIKLEKKIYKLIGEEFNLGSPKQLGEVLFIKMKIPGGKKTKTGTYSTDSAILESLSLQGYEVAKLTLEWREVSKLRSTYTDAIQQQIDISTKRVHTSYALATTLTGRLSSNDPNLQNIPIRTEKGKQIRNAFVAEKNHKLVSLDYSQIELRLAAEISKDDNFISAFINQEDIHSSTAKEIFNIAEKDLTSDHRRKAKAINFGILYGISPYGLAKQLSITNSDAKQYIENYFLKFPKIRDYMDFQINFAKINNYVETIFGRRCNIKGINDKNFAVRGFAERQSINAPIQGTAADIIKIAMIEIHRNILAKKLNAKILLQVHDELIFEIEDKYIEESCALITKIMENNHLQYKDFIVPLTVDYGVGNTWGESH
ncbi:DNA polymerase I [Alphaproteobacteria bacterium]|nr:DNA polymerase I [Alphaproteobacteria bacterium]